MNLKHSLVVLCAALSIYSCKNQVIKPKPIRPVKIADVVSFSITSNKFSAIVTPEEFSNLAFKMSGPLVAVNVQEGEVVTKGQIFAKLDPRDYQLAYDAKKASYITAKAQLDRAKKLLSKQAISTQEYESIRANEVNALAAYTNAKQTLDQTIIRAPFNGFIQQKFVENYQELRPGDKVVCLINPDKLQVEATLPENALDYITKNPQLYVEFDAYKGVKFKAKVKEYVQASPDGSGLPIYVKIIDPKFNLKDYKVAVGFSCSVELVIKDTKFTDYTIIPLTSVVDDPKTSDKYVYVYDSQTKKVSRRDILGGEIINKNQVVVLEGLTPGEKVISAGATRISDGEEVKLIKE